MPQHRCVTPAPVPPRFDREFAAVIRTGWRARVLSLPPLQAPVSEPAVKKWAGFGSKTVEWDLPTVSAARPPPVGRRRTQIDAAKTGPV